MPVDHSASSLITSATLLSFGSTITISCAVRKNLCALICGTFWRDFARQRPRADALRHRVADRRRLGRGRIGLHVLDELFDGVSLFQREVELGGGRELLLWRCARLRRSLRMRERGDRRQHQREGNKGLVHLVLPKRVRSAIAGTRPEPALNNGKPFSSGIVPSTVATCGARVRPATSPYGCKRASRDRRARHRQNRFAPS